MKIVGKVAAAVVGMFFGLTFLGALSVREPGQPALVMGFGGAGAVLGLLVVPRIVKWIRGAFVEESAAKPAEDASDERTAGDR